MDATVLQTLRKGVVIPAHPLALNAQRQLDERRQVALTRYYCDAGAGGIAVGVHTTQFAIRNPQAGSFSPCSAWPRKRRRVRAPVGKARGEGGGDLRPYAASRVGGRVRTQWRLRPRPVEPRCAANRRRRRIASALPRRRARNSGVRVLPAALGRRPPALVRILALILCHRSGCRHQGGALQSLPDAGRSARRGGQRPRGRDRAVYG
jgi:hypothetical protein